MCGGIAIVGAVSESNKQKTPYSHTVETTTPPVSNSPVNKPPAANPTTTKKTTVYVVHGNDIVHVGEDIPAGTYRTKDAVDKDAGCYWEKRKTAESDENLYNIISNDNVSGGRPEVTLKNGQWFESEDCPDWYKVG